jgi:3-methyl-2-oxobutanoate hydroxymethyltransferase
VTEEIMPGMEVPVIGIGAGPATHGQVLVFHDLLGIYDGMSPRFAKRFAQIKADMVAGVRAYADDVRKRRFPASEHTYSIDPEELIAFKAGLGAETALSSWEALEGF